MSDRTVIVVLLMLALLWCSRGAKRASIFVTPGSTVFEGGFFALKCENLGPSEDWKVLRNTSKRPEPRPCGEGWGKNQTNSCKVGLAVPWDSGLYWCQSPGGAVSNVISVRVTKGKVLLDAPVLPVFLGDDVILRCLGKNYSSVPAHFYKEDVKLTSDPRRDLPLLNISLWDGGSYRCISGRNTSTSAVLQVINKSRPLSESDFPSSQSPSESNSVHFHLALRLFCHLLVFCPYCISTVLMVSLYRRRHKDERRPETKVKKEDYEDKMAAVTTEYHF